MAMPIGLWGNTLGYSAVIHCFSVFSMGTAFSCRNCSALGGSFFNASSFIFRSMHRVAETCLMHILLCSYHFAVHLQICVLHVPYNATGLYPVFYQSRHMLHIHLFVNNLCNLLVYHPVLRVLVLFCNQTILIFVCCYDIPNSIPDGLCLFVFIQYFYRCFISMQIAAGQYMLLMKFVKSN